MTAIKTVSGKTKVRVPRCSKFDDDDDDDALLFEFDASDELVAAIV